MHIHYINHQSINHLTSINQTIGINENMIQHALRSFCSGFFEGPLPETLSLPLRMIYSFPRVQRTLASPFPYFLLGTFDIFHMGGRYM
jgi:hypothetical protein